uniref:Uncharacterized protein n=1 Tax=Oryza brachyantha TaxID=4533 RepID=J3N3Y3_ORYBR
MAGRGFLGLGMPRVAVLGAVVALRGAGGVDAVGGGGKPDRSIAGADVILVGFAAAVMVVVFWYIRITRKSSSSSVEAARKLEIIKQQPAVVVEA